MNITINAGVPDRFARIVLGILIIGIGYYYQSIWAVVGIIPLVSGLSGFCPLYGVFGISTCKAGNQTPLER